MTWLSPNFTVEDAITRGNDVWELLVDNWGNVAAPSADGTSLTFPAIGTRGLPAPAAIAIGPRSTVDRCWTIYDLQKLIPAEVTWDYARRVSVGAPLLFPEPANRGLINTSTDLDRMNSVQILPTNAISAYNSAIFDRTRFHNKYQRADGTLATFGAGATLGTVDPPGANWISPLLHLYFYLRAPTTTSPTKRFPLTGHLFATTSAAGEELVTQIPIFGRKTVIVSMDVAAAADLRLAVIHNISEDTLGGVVIGAAMRENTVFTQAAVPAASSVRAVINPAMGDYLMVYANFAASNSIYIRFYASDD